MCRPELIVNNDIARTAPITHEGSHSMRASLARIPLRNNGLTAFWRKFYESRPTLCPDRRLNDCPHVASQACGFHFVKVTVTHRIDLTKAQVEQPADQFFT